MQVKIHLLKTTYELDGTRITSMKQYDKLCRSAQKRIKSVLTINETKEFRSKSNARKWLRENKTMFGAFGVYSMDYRFEKIKVWKR